MDDRDVLGELNYHHLRYFWAVAQAGSLRRAATALHVAQSAVSSQIKQLERQLGQALFERRGRGLELTEAGRIALGYADTIFSVGTELVGTLRHQTVATTRLRIGAMATLSRNFLLEFLSPLHARTDVDLVVRSGGQADLLRELEAHVVDVVLTNLDPVSADAPWIVHRIADQPVRLIGPPRLAGEARDPVALLRRERVVLPSLATGIRSAFDAWAQRCGVIPAVAAEVDDMAMLRLLAREHDGVAVLPSIVVRDELAAGTLVELADIPDLAEHFIAVTLRRRFVNPLVQALLTRGLPDGRRAAGRAPA